MSKIEEAIKAAHDDAKAYDEKAKSARDGNRTQDSQYYDGVAHGIRLTALHFETKLLGVTNRPPE